MYEMVFQDRHKSDSDHTDCLDMAPGRHHAAGAYRNCACNITSSQQLCTVYLSKSQRCIVDATRQSWRTLSTPPCASSYYHTNRHCLPAFPLNFRKTTPALLWDADRPQPRSAISAGTERQQQYGNLLHNSMRPPAQHLTPCSLNHYVPSCGTVCMLSSIRIHVRPSCLRPAEEGSIPVAEQAEPCRHIASVAAGAVSNLPGPSRVQALPPVVKYRLKIPEI